jgi:hypothetical protein
MPSSWYCGIVSAFCGHHREPILDRAVGLVIPNDAAVCLIRADWARRMVMGMAKGMTTRTAVRYVQRLAAAGK